MQNFKSKIFPRMGIFLSFLVLFAVVYSAAVRSGYYFLDDYEYFTPPGGRSFDEFMHEAIREGRISEGLFLYLLSTGIQSSESTASVRLIGIAGIALFASLAYSFFRRSSFRRDQAFLISALICMLPPFQLVASWMIIIPSIYSALLASASALLTLNVAFNEEEKNQAHITAMLLIAVILLIIALSINQPPAMMYWAMGVAFFISIERHHFSKINFLLNAAKYFAVGLTSAVTYYIVFIRTIPALMGIAGRGRLVDIQHVPEKLKWFLFVPLNYAVNLWNIYPKFQFAFIIIAIILIGIIFRLLREIKDKESLPGNNFLKYSLVACLVMLSYLPNVLVTENEPGYRTLISLTTALSSLFFWGLFNLVEVLKAVTNFSARSRQLILSVVLVILTIVTASSAHSNVNKFASLYSSELLHMKNSIKDFGESNLLRSLKIYIRRPHILSSTQGREGEFGLKPNSTSQCGQILRMIKQALREEGVEEDIQIVHGAADDPLPEDKSILIIDMTNIQDLT